MSVSSEFQDGILIVTPCGAYEADELVEIIKNGYTAPEFAQTTHVLVDTRRSAANPSSDEMQQTCRRIIGQCPAGHRGRWAVVTGTDPLRFGIGRMSSLVMKTLGIPVEVFTEMDAALAYMRR
jgi:hypothetical protein